MRKFLSVVLIACMLLLTATPMVKAAPPTFARRGLTVTGVASDTALVLPAGTWVYGIGVFASSASATLGLFNTTTLGGVSDTNVKAEVGEATQYVTETVMLPVPVYFSAGVTAVINNGTGFIYSGPTP